MECWRGKEGEKESQLVSEIKGEKGMEGQEEEREEGRRKGLTEDRDT